WGLQQTFARGIFTEELEDFSNGAWQTIQLFRKFEIIEINGHCHLFALLKVVSDPNILRSSCAKIRFLIRRVSKLHPLLVRRSALGNPPGPFPNLWAWRQVPLPRKVSFRVHRRENQLVHEPMPLRLDPFFCVPAATFQLFVQSGLLFGGPIE